ncbi:DUF3558 domain-containing protein [Streptomyces tirandamycinicus]|uniref:DUF3558 domain-containing protein n=1 Tax=Streptomyces tirandamycinicus TaxID=2174846 RepID=A0A2S1SVL2_9ACTN|nr:MULTISPECIES: hypothetical protein [Streptomyces]AWI30317.1 hypothetical protein DDW44_17215 [Streptomyces tirandamycinicus]MCY0984397.1 DUF3558 domain-containing protein [Streptomyces tirandamycinicus]NNJ03949.1 DUF3558 domain-containing protein [Streptomyces sp. PKU-MA01144]TFE49518.1 DUF3558 domain-containing protein [Streptomyces sp. ICN441]
MRRKGYASGVAALLTALVTGCTGGSADGGATTEAKAGETAGPVAAPGKYRTLYEPCGAVERSMLRDLLPGAAELPEEPQEKVFRGTAAVTYDTDRRVGCSWKADAPDASHHLRIDVERVVSYDQDVSDEQRALEVYTRKQDAAELPAPAASGRSGTGAPVTGSPATGAEPSPGTTAPSGGAASGTPGSPGSPEGLQPRLLDGLGDAAFLDDVLTRTGSTARHRTVSVVFRTSNVIVTVEYGEQPARVTEIPDSKELQEKAQGLALKLAERFND